jgi:hypothetical protein
MPISIREKYEKLLEKLKDPIFYKEYHKKSLERQRRYARDPEYCKKRAIATADWRHRKQRGLPTRQRNQRKPKDLIIPKDLITPKTDDKFNLQLVSEISVDFN